MSKSNYRFGGNVTNTVPASRQNIEQRTPSGVRPVASPVTPTGDVLGRSNGGELEMNKPKKMAFGGPSGRMAPGGSKPGAPVNQRVPGVMPQYGGPVPNMAPGGMNPNMAPGAGGMPMAGGFGGSAGPGGFSMDGRANQFARGAMPQYGGRVPGMKKGGMASASSYEDMTGGAAGGIGRLEKSSIAAKTKSQKLKKGGKVKGYYEGGDINKSSSGGDYLSEGDRLAAKKAGIDPNAANNQSLSSFTPDRSIAMAEYRARQDAAEKRARKPAPKPAAKPKKPMSLTNAPVTKTSGPIDIPMEGGGYRGYFKDTPDAKAQEFLRRKRASDAANGPKYLKKGGKVMKYAAGGEMSLGDRIALERAGFDPETRMKRSGSSYGKAPYESADLPAPKKKAAPEPRPRPKMTPAASVNVNRAEQRNATERTNAGIRSQQSSAIDKMLDVARRNDNQREIDRLTKMKSGMKKGGKVNGFEGSFMDMVQDKKLAKKYGMSKKAYEKSPIDAKHDKQRSMKGLKKGGVTCGGMAMGGYASGGMSTAQDGMKPALRPKPSAMAKGGKVGMTFGKPLPGTKVSSQKIRATTATGASMKKDGMKGQLRAKASGAKPTNMMKPLGMTKMASGGKVRGAGCAQRGTKFIGEV